MMFRRKRWTPTPLSTLFFVVIFLKSQKSFRQTFQKNDDKIHYGTVILLLYFDVNSTLWDNHILYQGITMTSMYAQVARCV